ncbi:hypothetical protein BDZ45DRAFT_687371 [Acephala macrosclerotiorum]|nr:hypothetical protein BDZ45DRAFT_687371 [Acephala macrosclerotiorum]
MKKAFSKLRGLFTRRSSSPVVAAAGGNPSIDPTKLQIGASITLPTTQTTPDPTSTNTYTVQAGDTLSSIAQTYSVTVSDLEAANPIVTPNLIKIRQVINLPSNASSSPLVPIDAIPSIPNPATTTGTSAGGPFVPYTGPANWASYSYLWNQNSQLMSYNNFPSEITFIKSAIDIVAAESGVDARVILCIIIQESGGNVGVGNTFNGIANTGIMQAFNGSSFDAVDLKGSILQMVRDGTEGTFCANRKQGGGPGPKQDYAQTGKWYAVARVYNSGSVGVNQLNNALGATANYIVDFANRLMGHVWAQIIVANENPCSLISIWLHLIAVRFDLCAEVEVEVEARSKAIT